jgi:hypothetical protein
MRERLTGIMAAFVLAAGSAAAQDQDVIFFRAGPLDPAEQARGVAAMRLETVEVMMAEPFEMGEPVTDAPYSADVVTEIVQTLADGNRIERRTTSSVARDTQGRVRRAQRLAAIGSILPQGDAEIVTINDPVARAHYRLDVARKVAVRSAPVFTKRIESPPFAAAPIGAHVQVRRGDDSQTESLGTRQFDGVSAEGTRSTTTIPAGAIGNQAPILIVAERWYSPELRVVVASRRSDPRFGETVFRLENIVRLEPAAELFQVPTDFTIEAGRPFGAGVIQKTP